MLLLRCLLAFACGSLTLAAVAPAAGASERIVPLQRATPLSEHAGRLLVSRWDGSAYRLAVVAGRTIRDLAVAPQDVPFDADIGPDSEGRPSVVLSQCTPDGGCDLLVTGIDAGDAPRPVRNANTTDADEVAPSVWRGRLLFGRRYDADTTVPYTRPLRAPRTQRSRRLAGLPSTRCGAVDPPSCRRIEDVRLRRLELWGRWVGQSWTYQPDRFPGFRQNEVRLTDVARTDTRQLAAMTTGLGGQTFLGPSIADGQVAWFRACQGDSSGCEGAPSGAFRSRIGTGATAHAQANRAWEGWAYDGESAFHVPSAFDCSGGDAAASPAERCGVFRDGPPAWRPIDPARLR